MKFYITAQGKEWDGSRMIDAEKNSVVYAESEAEAIDEIERQGEKVLTITKG